MPRKAAQTQEEIRSKALTAIWDKGYHALSIEALTHATGASRQAIYSAFGSKHALYLDCFDAYRETVVKPAIDPLLEGGGISAIAAYFETQISLAESYGLPGPGCFVCNAMIETARHDPEAHRRVEGHNKLLKEAFAAALADPGMGLSSTHQQDLADILLIATQGLWAMSRVISSSKELRTNAERILGLIKERTQ